MDIKREQVYDANDHLDCKLPGAAHILDCARDAISKDKEYMIFNGRLYRLNEHYNRESDMCSDMGRADDYIKKKLFKFTFSQTEYIEAYSKYEAVVKLKDIYDIEDYDSMEEKEL